jgi:hypothetical protein
VKAIRYRKIGREVKQQANLSARQLTIEGGVALVVLLLPLRRRRPVSLRGLALPGGTRASGLEP